MASAPVSAAALAAATAAAPALACHRGGCTGGGGLLKAELWWDHSRPTASSACTVLGVEQRLCSRRALPFAAWKRSASHPPQHLRQPLAWPCQHQQPWRQPPQGGFGAGRHAAHDTNTSHTFRQAYRPVTGAARVQADVSAASYATNRLCLEELALCRHLAQ